MGCLCEAPVCRAGGGAGLFVPLHALGGDLEPAATGIGRTGRHLPLEGLPVHGAYPPQDDDTGGRRVHAPLSAACVAWRVSPYPPLRTARQCKAAGASSQGAGTAGGGTEGGGDRQHGCEGPPRPAALCMPVLRGGDGRRRAPRTQTVDPRSIVTSGLPMNTPSPMLRTPTVGSGVAQAESGRLCWS